MNATLIHSSLKSKLMARFVLFDFFVFDNDSFSVIVFASGPNHTVSIPYTIREIDDSTFELSTNSWTSECKSVQTAITLLVRDSRSEIARFRKYTK